jgi:hypothetical protein
MSTVRSAPQRKSPLDNPEIREFLDGLAVLIARRIVEGHKGESVEYRTAEAREAKAC